MPNEWTDRTVRGPAAEYLTLDELRRLFGVPHEWLSERVADGTLPPPIRLSAKTQLYSWRHAVFLSLFLELNGPAVGGERAGK